MKETGRVLRNGKEVPNRNNTVLEVRADISSPCYNKFKGLFSYTEKPNGIVVLGDGPLYVGLGRSLFFNVYYINKVLSLDNKAIKINNTNCLLCCDGNGERVDYKTSSRKICFLNIDYLVGTGETCVLTIGDWRIEVTVKNGRDGAYQYVKLIEPENTVWEGWSGYYSSETSWDVYERTVDVYKVELVIIDFDNVGERNIKDAIENTKYPNRCVSPEVMSIQRVKIDGYTDNHPLNNRGTLKEEYKKLFP